MSLASTASTADCTWRQEAKLVPADLAAFDDFGRAVAIDGARVLVGAWGKDRLRGAAYVFERTEQGWVETARLQPGDTSDLDLVGFTLGLSGDAALVGAWGQDGSRGAVYAFQRTAAGWQQVDKLAPQGLSPGAWFGRSLALDGDTAVVGAPRVDTVFLFRRRGRRWHLADFDHNPDAQGIGYTVAVRSDRVLAVSKRRSHRLWSYRRTGSTLQPTSALPFRGAFFGRSVAIDEGAVATGIGPVRSRYDPREGPGAVWLIAHRDGGLAGEQVTALERRREHTDEFGAAVALAPGVLAVGAPSSHAHGTNSGVVYLYRRQGTTATLPTAIVAVDVEPGDRFGQALAADGDRLVIGAPWSDACARGGGAVYVVSRQCPGDAGDAGPTVAPAAPSVPVLVLPAESVRRGDASRHRPTAQQRDAIYDLRSVRRRVSPHTASVDAGSWQPAAAAARADLQRARAAFGPESVDYEHALQILVHVLANSADVARDETLELAREGIELNRRLYGEYSYWNGYPRHWLGHILSERGELVAARQAHEEATELRADLSPDDPGMGSSYSWLGRIDQQLGDLPEAIAAFERSVRVRVASDGPDHHLVAASLAMLGDAYAEAGDYRAAEQLLRRASLVMVRSQGPEHSFTQRARASLARLLHGLGHYEESLQLWRDVAATQERVLGEHPHLAATLDGLAALRADMGEYGAARRLYSRSLRIRERTLGERAPELVDSLQNLGGLLLGLGDLDEARPYLERAVAIARQTLGPHHLKTASAVEALARLRLAYGRAIERPLLAQALATREAVLGPDHLEVAELLDLMAEIEIARGRLDAAAGLVERAVGIRRGSLSPHHAALAENLRLMAAIQHRRGDLARADQLYRNALRAYRSSFGEDHPRVAGILAELARLHRQQGATGSALRHAAQAEAIRRAHVRSTIRALPERQGLRFTLDRPAALDLMLSVAATDGTVEAVSLAFDAVVRARALVQDVVARRHRQAIDGGPLARRLLARLADARRRFANLTVQGLRDGPLPSYYPRVLGEARRAKEELEAELDDTGGNAGDGRDRPPIGLAEVAAALPAGSALVSYVRYRPEPAPAASGSAHAGSASYLALVRRAGEDDAHLVPLGATETIDRLVSEWYGAVSSPPGGSLAAWRRSEGRYRATGERLRRVIWDPIAATMAGTELVFVVPDGALNSVSLASLPAADGGYLVEAGPVFHLLSSERELVSRRRDPPAAPTGGELLLMGNPDFDRPAEAAADVAAGPSGAMLFRGAAPACDRLSDIRWPRLPGAARETAELRDLWRSAGDGDVLRLSGREAAERAFKLLASRYRVIHVATHGFFIEPDCVAEPVATADGDDIVAPALLAHNPLLLSGLVFAGANRDGEAAQADGEDGLLTAEEIAALDLFGVEWVVLSACETGRGAIQSGEGVLGMRRAFHVAGARSLIMSLWRVQEEATRSWMRHLYRARLDGQSTAAAVHSATRSSLARRRQRKQSTHPFFWAAFVGAGDWR